MNMPEDAAHEECGIVGVYDKAADVAPRIYYALMALQHRGQEACGISVFNGSRVVTRKYEGLVADTLHNILPELEGQAGIGHVRYSTVGSGGVQNAQPLGVEKPHRGIMLAHNGNVVNYVQLREKMFEENIPLTCDNDAELLVKLFAQALEETGDIFASLAEMNSQVEGAYSLIAVTGEGEVIGARDPYGFRPMSLGQQGSSYMIASESVALDMNGYDLVADVKPGEAIVLSQSGIERRRFAKSKRRAHCYFEYVYFSRPDSVIENRTVYDIRFNLGVQLARDYGFEGDVIVPVPDTSRPAAEGLSSATNIPVAEGLIKNRYIARTFIMPEEKQRAEAVKIKLNPIRSVVKGKRVIVVDDSIVRGLTSRSIVSIIKKAGAKSVHLVSTCPPLVSPCFYGIDIATHRELIAAAHTNEEIRRTIGTDTLHYQTIDGLVKAIGMPSEDLCKACITGKYPTERAQAISDRLRDKAIGRGVRYWEAAT